MLRAIGCQLQSVMIFPIVLRLPSMFFPVPPLVILIPTTLPFGIQIPSPILGFAAVLALVMDRFVQSCFRLFDCMLALPSVIGMRPWCCYKQQKRHSHCRCHCCFSKLSVQDSLLSVKRKKDAFRLTGAASLSLTGYWPIESLLAGTSFEVISKVSMNPLVPLNSKARSLSR